MIVYSELMSSTYRPKNKWFETRLFGNSRFDFSLNRTAPTPPSWHLRAAAHY